MAFSPEEQRAADDQATTTSTPIEMCSRLEELGMNSSPEGGGTRTVSDESLDMQQHKQKDHVEPGTSVTGLEPERGIKRQEGKSDLWQHIGAFRTNRKSMQSMFKEFEAELESAEKKGRTKAEVGDIFSYTLVGYKHLSTSRPSEDRIAIHQAVVPTIDAKDKKELDIESIDTTPFAMFGVFDGHGGPACAEFLTKSVATVLAHSPVLYDQDLTPYQRRACATADSFEELEKVHNAWAEENGDLSGSTAILSTFQDGVLVMAGVGDSAGLYVDHMGRQNNLCPQHSTSNQKEVERVLSMGGTIINNRVAGCLMPTRTIGDLDCKRALGAIVSPHPELKLAAIYAPPDDGEPHDEPFLVLASDGLWDVLTFAEVAFITRGGLRRLRAHEDKERAKKDKADAKATHKNAAASEAGTPAGGENATESGGKKSRWRRLLSKGGSSKGNPHAGGNGSSSTFARNASTVDSNFQGISAPRQGGGSMIDASKTGWMDASRRSFMDGSTAGYLDRSIRGLDASVRNGKSAVATASLDSSLYAGLRAEEKSRMMDTSLHEVTEGVPTSTAGEAAAENQPPVKELVIKSTQQTASVRTTGALGHNVAMHLAQAAQRADSTDDISVVVVTFKGAVDKSPPGSRRLTGSTSNLTLSQLTHEQRSGPDSSS